MENVNVDVDLPLPKLKAPLCDTAGIIFPKVNCELSYFTNLGVYGFKYGYIFGEHGNGDAIYAATCTHAFAFSGGSHLICLGLLSAELPASIEFPFTTRIGPSARKGVS